MGSSSRDYKRRRSSSRSPDRRKRERRRSRSRDRDRRYRDGRRSRSRSPRDYRSDRDRRKPERDRSEKSSSSSSQSYSSSGNGKSQNTSSILSGGSTITTAIDQNLNKDTEQARLEEEMRKRRERIELVSKYCYHLYLSNFKSNTTSYRFLITISFVCIHFSGGKRRSKKS